MDNNINPNEQNVIVENQATNQNYNAPQNVVQNVIPNTTPIVAEPNKKSSNSLMIGTIVCCGLFILLIIGLLITGIFSSSKSIVKKEISTVFTVARKSIQAADKNTLDLNLDQEDIGIEGNLTLKSNTKSNEFDLTKLEDYKIAYRGVVSKSNNNASLTCKLTKKDDIIDAKIYVEKDTIYMNLGDIYNKTIKFGEYLNDEIKENNYKSVDLNDIDTLLAKTEQILKNNINGKNISKTKEKKTLNNETKKYTKVSYKINMNEQTKLLLTEYKKDKKIIRIISNLYNMTEDEVKNYIDESLTGLENAPDSEEITINVYLDGILNTTKGIEILDGDTTIIAEVNKNVYNYKMMSEQEELGYGIIDIDQSKFTYNYNISNTKIELNWKQKDTITGKYSTESTHNNYNIEFTLNNKTGKNEMTSSLNVKMDASISGEKYNLELDTDYTMKKGAKLERLATTDAISIDEITDEDMNNIYNNLINKVQVIINDIAPGLNAENQFRKIY